MKGLARAIARRLGLASHLTPAQQDLLRRALAASGGRLNKDAAPGWNPGAADADGWKEPKDMTTSIPREAHELRPGDVITRHPDHPAQEIRYRVQTWPKALEGGAVLIDYTAPSVRAANGAPLGPATGTLVLNADQQCAIEPTGGAR